ncbi:hypothetical protein FA95DRAFT_1216184 [Auriscalpium vulgare]|uniref:Uncharacterized protein n=1 Tax=Auriscalpium vulgare TaxID=40419 RepID=A0ACB8RTF5_9AGAM|nr:hypothetical protein FA95DRAFT_1216184 [Auriscalpium vulgare]
MQDVRGDSAYDSYAPNWQQYNSAATCVLNMLRSRVIRSILLPAHSALFLPAGSLNGSCLLLSDLEHPPYVPRGQPGVNTFSWSLIRRRCMSKACPRACSLVSVRECRPAASAPRYLTERRPIAKQLAHCYRARLGIQAGLNTTTHTWAALNIDDTRILFSVRYEAASVSARNAQ